MRAVYAQGVDAAHPLAMLRVGEMPEPQSRPYWSTVAVRAASLNHHDLWSLQGVGLAAERTPMILGTDAAGVLLDDIAVGGAEHAAAWRAGDRVAIYGVIGTDGAGVGPGERRSMLSERYPGTMAQRVAVPSANIMAAPANLDDDEVAILGTSWLTAYAMLFGAARVKPGDTVLVQGAGGEFRRPRPSSPMPRGWRCSSHRGPPPNANGRSAWVRTVPSTSGRDCRTRSMP